MTAPQDMEKTKRRTRLYRWYGAIAALVWFAAFSWGFAHDRPEIMFFVVPAVLPAFFMTFNLMAFHGPFSVFGTRERSSAPPEPSLAEARATAGQVGLLHATAPFFTWRIYDSGIGFRILGVGEGFVQFSSVRRAKRRWFGGCTIWHDSMEVRSPLVTNSRVICDRVCSSAARWGYECAA